MLIAALVGFAFGFIASMPIAGPITALMFVRSVDGEYRSALYIGIGSVFAEAAYAFLAFWGFSTLLAEYSWIVPVAHGIAAALLLGLGIAFIRRRAETEAPDKEGGDRVASLLIGLSISGLNPTLLATWAGASTMLFSTGWVDFSPSLALPFALGAGFGILCWYFVLVRLVRHYRSRFSQDALNRVIRWFGVFLLLVSGWFVWRLVDALSTAT